MHAAKFNLLGKSCRFLLVFKSTSRDFQVCFSALTEIYWTEDNKQTFMDPGEISRHCLFEHNAVEVLGIDRIDKTNTTQQVFLQQLTVSKYIHILVFLLSRQVFLIKPSIDLTVEWLGYQKIISSVQNHALSMVSLLKIFSDNFYRTDFLKHDIYLILTCVLNISLVTEDIFG